MKKHASVIIIILISAIGILAGFNGLYPVKPKKADAPAGEFSAARAIEKLKVIAARPHPTGFMTNRFVKDYLVDELQKAGLDPVVIPDSMERNEQVYYIENILAVKRGTGGPNAGKILLSAHYDARGEAPGAGDNGYAVASILETLRALKSYPPLKNDLVIIFPDGEEMGSLGAKAFVRDEKLADSIDLVLNFDGRGSSGTSLMFETSLGNYWLMKEFSKSKNSSFSNSLSDEIYHMIPNYTDFTWYLKKAPQGLNFAHVGSVENYHNPTDDLAHLDQGTVQSHGNSMLGCVLHFGNISLKEKPEKDAVYFHFLFPGLFVYPGVRALPFAIIVINLFLLVFIAGRRKAGLTFPGLFATAGIFLLRIVLIAVAVHFTWKILGPLNEGFGHFELDWVKNGDYILEGFLFASLIGFFIWQGKVTEKFGAANAAMGPLFIWLLLTLGTAIYIRGASYLFIWPLVSCLAGMVIYIRKREKIRPPKLALLLMLFTLPGIYLFTQVIWLFYETMTLRMAGAIAAMFVLLLGTLQTALISVEDRS